MAGCPSDLVPLCDLRITCMKKIVLMFVATCAMCATFVFCNTKKEKEMESVDTSVAKIDSIRKEVTE